MVNNHYRSLQRGQNCNFYMRDTPVKDRTPFNWMAPDQRRAYDTRFLKGYDTVFDDCRLHRRAYICPFCPSHPYCFDTPDHNNIGIFHNSAQRVIEHVLEFHLPFQYFYLCHLCDEHFLPVRKYLIVKEEPCLFDFNITTWPKMKSSLIWDWCTSTETTWRMMLKPCWMQSWRPLMPSSALCYSTNFTYRLSSQQEECPINGIHL